MAFQKVNLSKKFFAWDKMSVGDQITGMFTGRYPSKFSRPGFNQDGFIFRADDGTQQVVNYCGSLNYAFGDTGEYEEGSYVRLTYEGKKPLKSGQYAGTLAHHFGIEYDPERSQTNGRDFQGGRDGFGSVSHAPEDDPANYPSYDDDGFDAGSLM